MKQKPIFHLIAVLAITGILVWPYAGDFGDDKRDALREAGTKASGGMPRVPRVPRTAEAERAHSPITPPNHPFPPDSRESPDPVERAIAEGEVIQEKILPNPLSGRWQRARLVRSGIQDRLLHVQELWENNARAIRWVNHGRNIYLADQVIAWVNPGEIPGDGIDNDGSGRIDDVSGWDFTNADNNPVDDHGHGSNVTGIIAATRNNSLGIAGMIGGVKIIVCKILNSSNSGTTSNLIAATTYARLAECR